MTGAHYITRPAGLCGGAKRARPPWQKQSSSSLLSFSRIQGRSSIFPHVRWLPPTLKKPICWPCHHLSSSAMKSARVSGLQPVCISHSPCDYLGRHNQCWSTAGVCHWPSGNLSARVFQPSDMMLSTTRKCSHLLMSRRVHSVIYLAVCQSVM